MAEDNERIEQIRSRRSRRMVDPETMAQRQAEVQQQRAANVGQSTDAISAGTMAGSVGVGSPTPWLQDRVTLSLEAQIAMIEMRGTYKLTLADLGYHNRLKIINIRPGIFLKVESTGCYKMSYHNRV